MTAHAASNARAGKKAPAGTKAAARAVTWTEANQSCLAAHLARVRGALERHAGTASGMTPEAAPAMAHDHPATLDTLCRLFGLSPFERDVLLDTVRRDHIGAYGYHHNATAGAAGWCRWLRRVRVRPGCRSGPRYRR